ncbi:DUF4244 domain-containing protein [Herbiconiux ginsengi]|uniref:DUF4244 domain-containing protein n=1 Tax=Herbiconiux ginsengi TaxID=381665 RepID=A0A1H3SR64_9MICO|nr:DUF4244 domain-containing protein [Herbiconiux ginsengi]SDZ40041.1 Protein of unknown function [Herbiconiux ginsengi]
MNTTAIAVRGSGRHDTDATPAGSAFATPAGALHRVALAVRDESGAATAEYAIATLAAVGFAGLLVAILRGDEIKGMLTDLIHRALTLSI